MSKVVLFEALPRVATTGATVAVRLAGGGSKAYDQLGFNDWRGGIVAPPKFTSAIGFDQSGVTGAALPQIANLRFFTSDPTLVDTLAGYVWSRAAVTIKVDDDEAASPTYPVALTGTVASVNVAGGVVTFTISDLSIDLDAAAVPNSFAGTGGIEGGSEALGRVKRRSFGYCFNVEGRVLDKANNIYEFGDPSKPLSSMPLIKDKGRAASSVTLVAWAGSIGATLAALIATAAPNGGAAYAPSIACVKWWTVPAGPLTADLIGEVSNSAIAPARLASYLIAAYAPAISIANLATAEGWVNRPAGVHIESASESIASVFDRLLFPVGLIWSITPAGLLTFDRLTWASPIESLTADTIRRETVFQPLRTRRVGYQKNHRIHTDGEISAALDFPTFRQTTPPSTAVEGNFWVDTDDNNLLMRHSGLGLFINGVELTINGARIDIPWVSVQDQKVVDGINAQAALTTRVAEAERNINAISSDNILQKGEKAEINRQYNDINSEYANIVSKSQGLGVVTELATFTASYLALVAYIATLPTTWNDANFDTPIVGSTFRSSFSSYVTSRTALLAKNDEVAATKALWSGVSGTGGQPSGADVAGTVNPGGGVSTNKVNTAAILSGAVSNLTAVSSGTLSTDRVSFIEIAYVTVPSGTAGSVMMSAYGQVRNLVGGTTPGVPGIDLYKVTAANAAAYLASGSAATRNPNTFGLNLGRRVIFQDLLNVDMGGTISDILATPAVGDLYILVLNTTSYPPGGGSVPLNNYQYNGVISILELKK